MQAFKTLGINSQSGCLNGVQTSHSSNQQVFGVGSVCDSSEVSTEHLAHGGVPCCSCTVMTYEPELSSQDNPHYYDINEQLFNAHREKVMRSASHSSFK